MAFKHIVLCGAQITAARIVAPLGMVAVAANSLAVTAESLCYMPGYGIAAAAATLVGQRIGAGRRDMARRFARLAGVWMAMCGELCVRGVLFLIRLLRGRWLNLKQD